MQKLFTLACGVVLAASATAQITTQPEGVVHENLVGTVQGIFPKGYYGTESTTRNGLVGKVVEGTDGNLYFNTPIGAHALPNNWVKLDKVSEGHYRMNLPQAYATFGEFRTSRTYYLKRMTKSGDKYVVDNDHNYVDYTWDGTTLKMQGWENNDTILGEVTNGNDWAETGDFAQSFTKAPAAVTPPETAKRLAYTLDYKGNPNGAPYEVEIAMDGIQAVYVKNFTNKDKFANTWVKLVLQGGKYVFDGNPYLGVSDKTYWKGYDFDENSYHTYLVNKDANVSFTYGFTDHSLIGTGALRVLLGLGNDPETLGFFTMDSIVMKPRLRASTEPAQPKKPEVFVCSATTSNEVDYDNRLSFYIFNTDVNGATLDASKIYYNIFVNGSTTPFTFKRLSYPYISEDLTNIGYNYKDAQNSDIKIGLRPENLRTVHIYGNNSDNIIKKLAVQVVYQDGDKVLKSEILEADVANAPEVTAIDAVRSDNKATEEIYGVDGRKRTQLLPGVNLVKSSKGTVRKVVVK